MIKQKKVIPLNTTYIISKTGERLYAGELFPKLLGDGDIFLCGDYEYRFGEVWMRDFACDWVPREYVEDFPTFGWGVRVRNTSQKTYGPILAEIGDALVVDLTDTFYACTKMVKAPEIPDSVETMVETFRSCIALRRAPNISGRVTNLHSAFMNCKSLRGEVIVDMCARDLEVEKCFAGTVCKIKLSGLCSLEVKDMLVQTSSKCNIKIKRRR